MGERGLPEAPQSRSAFLYPETNPLSKGKKMSRLAERRTSRRRSEARPPGLAAAGIALLVVALLRAPAPGVAALLAPAAAINRVVVR